MNRFVETAVACCLAVAACSALAADPYPPAPGSGTALNPAPKNTLQFDKNGDGAIELSELDPNSQLAKRFATRDKNHDGKLTNDEYFVK